MAEYEASGLGRTTFCQQRGLSLSTLARYRRRQQQAGSEMDSAKRWLAVELRPRQFPGSGARKLSSPTNNYLSGSFPHW